MTCSEDQTFNSERLATLQGDPRTKPQMVWSLDEADLFWLVIRTWTQWSGTRTLRYLWINPMVLELEPLELPWFLWCKGYGTQISGGYWMFLGASRFSLKPRGPAHLPRHSEVSYPPGGRPGIHIGVRGTQSQIRTLWAMLIFRKPTCHCPDSLHQASSCPILFRLSRLGANSGHMGLRDVAVRDHQDHMDHAVDIRWSYASQVRSQVQCCWQHLDGSWLRMNGEEPAVVAQADTSHDAIVTITI